MNQTASKANAGSGSGSSAPFDSNRRVAVSLPAQTWREIELELRARGAWWLANQLVNTGNPVFSSVCGAPQK